MRIKQSVVGSALVLLTVLAPGLPAQGPATRAEQSDYRETSRYQDVLDFLHALDPGPHLHLRWVGYSFEGRALPLVVAARGLQTGSPSEVRAAARLRVLVFANIHGGEVEGKEAAQMLLRSIASGQHESWLDSLAILVVPILNADGNERVAVANRARQNGPEGGVGTRENAQGLDLNRDHTKLTSPEIRALVGIMSDYDPHVVVDLHSTNGTRHAYHLTYSPPLHPSTHTGITDLLRVRWLPEVTGRIHRERGWHFYYYGNAYAPAGLERGWYTFDHRPRFNTNYVGLRNRVAILSEAYSYLDFRGRVEATLAFIEAILDFARDHAPAIRDVVRQADEADLVGRDLAVRAEFNRDGVAEILMGGWEERLSRVSGQRYIARTDAVSPETMPEYGTFRATETERVPGAYFIPAHLARVVDVLKLHGITMDRLDAPVEALVERFVVDSTRVADREFQGHRESQVFGRWQQESVTLSAGTLVLPMDQPLARLAFHLLEPRSDDGLVNWNILDPQVAPGSPHFPVLRRPPPE
jgi:hypothetical protein